MPILRPRRRMRRTALLAVGSLLAYGCADGGPTEAAPAGPSATSLPATPVSLVTGGAFAAVNAAGLVVGTYATSTADSALAHDPALGRRTLATLDAGKKTFVGDRAHGVNATGWIVGESNDRTGAQRAVLWSSVTAQPQDLGSLRTGGMSWAYDVNAGGTVAGAAEAAGGVVHPFTWTSGGGMVDLSPAAAGAARALNDNGDVVGSVVSGGQTQAFVWRVATGMQVLGTLGGTLSEALDINRYGAVVGRSRNAAGQMRAFLWTTSAGFKDLGTLGGTLSVATGISDAGIVVGYSTNAAGQTRAFAWTSKAGMRDLGALGHPSASAAGISPTGGLVAGGAVDAAGTRYGVRWSVAEVNTRPSIEFALAHDTIWEGDNHLFAPAWSDADDDPVHFAWTFGDATSLNVPATRTPPAFYKVYRDQGVFAVRVIATDPSLTRDTATQTLVVLNRAPGGTLNVPFNSVFEAMSYGISARNITDGPADVAAGIQISFSCGYGVWEAYATASNRTCPALPDNDTLTVGVRLRDKDAAVTEYTRTLVIHNAPPLSGIIAQSPTTFAAGGSFSVRGTVGDPGAGDGPWKYRYFWGDGTYTQGFVNALGAVPQVSHVYPAAGGYLASLWMTDKDGRTGKSASIIVNVTP